MQKITTKSGKQVSIEMGDLSDFRPMDNNANDHTERGMAMLERSVEQVGYLSAMTASEDGVIIDGNARSEVVFEKLGSEAIIIKTDGTVPIIHQRIDMDSNDEKAEVAAIAANRVAQENLSWNPNVIASLQNHDTFKRMGLWSDKELAAMTFITSSELPDLEDEPPIDPDNLPSSVWPVLKLTLPPMVYAKYLQLVGEFNGSPEQKFEALLEKYETLLG